MMVLAEVAHVIVLVGMLSISLYSGHSIQLLGQISTGIGKIWQVGRVIRLNLMNRERILWVGSEITCGQIVLL